jgi:hypothetical protein
MRACEGAPKGAQEAWKRSLNGSPGGPRDGANKWNLGGPGKVKRGKRKGRRNQIMGEPRKASGQGGPESGPKEGLKGARQKTQMGPKRLKEGSPKIFRGAQEGIMKGKVIIGEF